MAGTINTRTGKIRLLWQSPGASGVWTTCYGVRYDPAGRPHIYTYPCQQLVTKTVENTASHELRIFSRITSISGRVTDTNQKPVPGATIYLSGTRQSTTATSDGSYEFRSYEISNNYTLINQIPTVTETLSIEAIACEPQSGKTVQVPAERGTCDVNFTLKRSFYPQAIALSEFTFDAFSGWAEAKKYSTWQDILGITIDGPAKPGRLLYGTKEISPPLFHIGNKKLYLITRPEFGRYFVELEGTQYTEYAVSASATLDDNYLEPVSVNGRIETENGQRVRVVLKQGGIEVVIIKPFPLLLVIIPTVVSLVGGLVAAFFLGGGRLPGLGKAFAGIKLPQIKRTPAGKAQDKARSNAEAKKEKEAKEKAGTRRDKTAAAKSKKKT